ncbi:MAG: peptidoglycan DD-metalloendopeptidase family protein [Gammaproteobacteria bacterium]|jgi:lipoprotein NlpD
MRVVRAILLGVGIAAVAGCGGGVLRWETHDYTVRAGDTLYSIAWRFGLDYHDLARWNRIGDDYTIYPGQHLILAPPAEGTQQIAGASPGSSVSEAKAPSAPPAAGHSGPLDWSWPAGGRILARFGDRGSVGKGIDIGGQDGEAIHAAADGRVVYTGSGLIGYGKTIIIKHDDHYLSAYAHNREILVDEGDEVRVGDTIARMGEGTGGRSMLHFEIRRNGKAVDPLDYLPPR